MTSRPYVILNAAMSIDGKIAALDGSSRMSSAKDWVRVHELRGSVDAIMVGINTVLIDDPSLTNRSGAGKNPIRVIVDSKARLPLGSKMLLPQSLARSSIIVACAEDADPGARKVLEKRKGVRVITLPKDEENGRGIDLKVLLSILYEMRVERLLLEGGSDLNWGMISNGLVDEIRLTIAPIIIGGKNSKSLVGGAGFQSISDSLCLELLDLEFRKETSEAVLRYKVRSRSLESEGAIGEAEEIGS